MMEFTDHGLVRWGVGFHNPHHAAAAICAILPFLWGWRRFAWVGWALSAALVAAIALTYSRTGFAVAALEIIAWAVMARRRSALLLLLFLGVAALAGGVSARFAPDAAAMNRPSIWWAGLKLAAANPLGVGHGNSGLLASAFMLDGIEVRTLVNSHLTLFAEHGWFVGCAWIAFVIVALAGGWRRHPRIWVSFAGLVVSAFASSVFDWHVLFDFTEKGGLGPLNFWLSWVLFAAFLAMGAALVFANGKAFILGRKIIPVWQRRIAVFVAVVSGLMVLRDAIPIEGVPLVRGGFVVKYGREMPVVLHDSSWPLKAVLPYLEDGYLLSVKPGYAKPKGHQKSVWLFGTVAESAHRFPDARITVVDPPEFCQLPDGTEVRK